MTYRINDNGVDRDMTPAEVVTYEASQASIDAEREARLAEVAALAAAKASARAKLAALGLSEAEVSALLGA